MKNGRLQDDLSAEVIIARGNANKQQTTIKFKCYNSENQMFQERDSCKHETKYNATAHMNPLEDYQTPMLLPVLSVMTKKV